MSSRPDRARYVVVGTARSATMYAAHLLTAVGLDCRHEHTTLDDGGDYVLPPSWGESSCYIAPFLPTPVPVVHLIRPPLDVIGSLAGRAMLDGALPGWERFTRAYTPEVFEHPPGPERAAAYWLTWNRLIEPHADMVWRVHALTRGHVTDLARRAGLHADGGQVDRALRDTSQDTNARSPVVVSLDDLGDLAVSVAAAADRYDVPLTSYTLSYPSEAFMPDSSQEAFRNVRTGHTWYADIGSRLHGHMSGSEDFERVEPEPPKPKRTRKTQPALDAPVQGPAPEGGDES